jgi:hypothetical protein
VSAFLESAFGGWLVGFAFTQAIEVPLYLRVTHGRWRVAFLASLLTHPIVWFVFPALCPLSWGYWGMVAAAEAFAVAGETLWLRVNGVTHALKWAFVVNAASAVGGLLLRAAFDVP